MIYWFYGQPGSGKTTLAKALKEHLELNNHRMVQHIDGDELRHIFDNKDYSKEGRLKNLRNVNNIARYLSYKGWDVVISVVAPYKETRNELRDLDVEFYYVHTNEDRGREDFFVERFEVDCRDQKLDTTNKSVLQTLNEIFTIHR
jgi:adenylylsulfate kinase-like enzyme